MEENFKSALQFAIEEAITQKLNEILSNDALGKELLEFVINKVLSEPIDIKDIENKFYLNQNE